MVVTSTVTVEYVVPGWVADQVYKSATQQKLIVVL